MSAIDDLIQALETLKQKPDGTILYAAEVHNLVDGIFAAMEMAGDVTVATTPIEGGNKVTITDPEGVVHEFDVMDGVDGAPGNNGHNPCLGVFADQTALETAHPTAEVGDYAYADVTDSTTQTTTSHIFRYGGSAWVDNGEGSPDNQTAFDGGTGPTVNATKIDDTQLANPASNALAKAADVAVIKSSLSEETEVGFTAPLQLKIDGETLVTAADTFPEMYQRCWYIPVSQGDNVKCIVTISPTAKMVRYGFCQSLPADGVSVVESKSISGTNVEIKAKSPVTGYFVINHTTQQVATTHKFYIVTMSLPDRIKENLSETGYFFAKDEDITAVVSSLPVYSMFIGANSGNWSSGSGRKHVLLDATGIMSIVITPNSENSCDFAFLASYETPVDGVSPDYVDGTARISATEETEFRVPSGTKWICFNAVSDTANYMPSNVVVTGRGYAEQPNVEGGVVKTIYPLLRYGTIRASNGKYDENPDYANRRMVVTPRYIKIAENFKITSSITIRMSVFCYDNNFEYLGRAENGAYNVVANTALDVHVLSETEYVKILFTKNENYDVLDIPPMVSLEGNFDDNWDVFNVRPLDNGYYKVQVVVNVTNPTCCDAETSTVQDEPNYMVDYGVICLPETYTNNGPATRLIIYCHGAAVNYADNVSRFDSQDLDPTYWLAEGYAVMDVEGNPFNNTNEHFCIPQAMDCYLAAYKWAIEHFNIRRDGVFLGGRSMGGGMTFALVREQCPIPVIAACPNSPWSTAIGNQSAARKNFWATHCGFDIPAGYTFGNNTLSNNDKALFYDNFDKLIKNNPVMASVLEVPKTADEKQAFVNCYASLLPDRKTLWETYRMKAKCPVKLFGCNQDETCPPDYTSGLFYRMLINGAQIAELRLYNSYKDYTGTGTTAHHYDTQDPALRATVTTRYGEQLTNVPIVYIEMLQFWRRFEQEN